MAKKKRKSSGKLLAGRASDILKVLAEMERILRAEERKRRKSKNPAPLGTGARFRALVKKLASRTGVTRTGKSRVIRHPKALAAWIGRKKYGTKKFAQLAARGKWRKRAEAAARKRKAANPRKRRR